MAGKAREEKLVKLVTDFGNVLEKLRLFTCKWTCPHCGKVHERDVKAAINIKRQDRRLGCPFCASNRWLFAQNL